MLWRGSFSEIIRSYDHSKHAVIQPLVEGGPAALVEKFGLSHENEYAARLALQEQFLELLTPDQMYGAQKT